MLSRDRLDPFFPKDLVDSTTAFEGAVYDQRAALLLREMRLRAGLSVEQLAGRLDRSPDEVDKIERGQTLESPTMKLMFEIADICHASVAFRVGHHHVTA